MGSEVFVASELGKGTRFWFDLTLPVVTANEKEKTHTNRYITGYQGVTRTILVVDDKEQNRTLLSSMLFPLGFEISEAQNGREEVEMTRQIKPDLILTDLLMPVMSGFEAVKEIRQFAPQMPIIAISASVFEMDQQKSRLAGCDAFLPKPVDEQTLLTLIAQHLQLEWIYDMVEDKDNEEAQEETIEHKRLNASLMIPPPAEELELLYEFAMLGKISDLRKWVVRIEQLDQKYVPFAKKVSQLGKVFEDEKIMALVEEYLVN